MKQRQPIKRGSFNAVAEAPLAQSPSPGEPICCGIPSRSKSKYILQLVLTVLLCILSVCWRNQSIDLHCYNLKLNSYYIVFPFLDCTITRELLKLFHEYFNNYSFRLLLFAYTEYIFTSFSDVSDLNQVKYWDCFFLSSVQANCRFVWVVCWL